MRLYMQTLSHRPQGSWASLDFGIWGSPETSRQGYWGMALIRYLIVACVSWGFACLAWNYPHFAPLCSETLCVDSREEEKKYTLSFPGCHSPQLWVDTKVKLPGMAESVLSQWRRPFGFLRDLKAEAFSCCVEKSQIRKCLKHSQDKISPGKRHVRASHQILPFQTSEAVLFL